MVFQALQWQLLATPNENSWKFLIMMPPHYGSTILSTYDIHNKISFWQHSKAIGFFCPLRPMRPKFYKVRTSIFVIQNTSIYINISPQDAGVDRRTLFSFSPPYSRIHKHQLPRRVVTFTNKVLTTDDDWMKLPKIELISFSKLKMDCAVFFDYATFRLLFRLIKSASNW